MRHTYQVTVNLSLRIEQKILRVYPTEKIAQDFYHLPATSIIIVYLSVLNMNEWSISTSVY